VERLDVVGGLAGSDLELLADHLGRGDPWIGDEQFEDPNPGRVYFRLRQTLPVDRPHNSRLS
jgi:hypothetical protein